MTTADLYNRRLVLFSGKGGVGKTTMASAFALSCARRGERTLLMELDAKNKTSSLFGAGEIGPEITEIDDNLFAVAVTPAVAMKEYALMILKIKLIYRAVFENRVVSSFLRVVPGLNELVMLGKAYYHATETDDDDKPVWDKVVIDAPATGHGIFFLKIPSVITNLISSGLMFDEAGRILDLLRDPKRTGLALVTLAEDMPVNETLMLDEILDEEMGLSVACVFANAIYRPIFSNEEARWINDADTHVTDNSASEEADGDGDSLEMPGFLASARFRNDRVQMQQQYLQKLSDEGDWPLLEIPFYFYDRMSFAIIDEIAQDMEALLDEEQSKTQSVG